MHMQSAHETQYAVAGVQQSRCEWNIASVTSCILKKCICSEHTVVSNTRMTEHKKTSARNTDVHLYLLILNRLIIYQQSLGNSHEAFGLLVRKKDMSLKHGCTLSFSIRRVF